MAQVTVNIPDSQIIVDGEALTFEFDYFPSKLRVIQWNGANGTMEFTRGANQWFDNPEQVQDYIDQFNAEKARLAALV